MRNRIGLCLGAALTLTLASPIVSNGEIRRPPGRGVAREAIEEQPFSVSGMFSGAVSGNIVLNGGSYRLAPNAVVYEIGNGVVPPGTSFGNRVMFVTGFMQGASAVVYGVIVRPAEDAMRAGDDPSTHIRIMEAGTPR